MTSTSSESDELKKNELYKYCEQVRKDVLRSFFKKVEWFGKAESVNSREKWGSQMEVLFKQVPGLKKAVAASGSKCDPTCVDEVSPDMEGLTLEEYRNHIRMLIDAWNKTAIEHNYMRDEGAPDPMAYVWRRYQSEANVRDIQGIRKLIGYVRRYSILFMDTIHDSIIKMNTILKEGFNFGVHYLNPYVMKLYLATPHYKKDGIIQYLLQLYREYTAGINHVEFEPILTRMYEISGLYAKDLRLLGPDKLLVPALEKMMEKKKRKAFKRNKGKTTGTSRMKRTAW